MILKQDTGGRIISVSKATSFRLESPDSYPSVGENFFAVQNGLEPHPAFCTKNTRSFLGLKRSEGGPNQPLPKAGL